MVPWLLRSTAPYEGDSATILVFSTSPNDNDYFYVKRENGGIDVKVVRLLSSPLQGQVSMVGGGSEALQGQIGGVRGVLGGGVCGPAEASL